MPPQRFFFQIERGALPIDDAAQDTFVCSEINVFVDTDHAIALVIYPKGKRAVSQSLVAISEMRVDVILRI